MSKPDDIDEVMGLSQPLSTYIRNAALAAATVIDVETARRQLGTAAQALAELRRSLSTAA